ncbi:MAG: NmrA family NAD(P)-binding protein [Acidobacteriota bacterium]|nr:NmrA family NAD(P)-binding protein [Acidobacteriota bacterium]
MKVLVLGGTGTVGSEVVRELLDRKLEVKVLTRSAEKAAKLPAGAQGIIGDLLKPETIRRIFTGVDSLFLLNGNTITESQEGFSAISGAKAAGVKRLVYLSAMGPENAPHVPHLGSKIGIEFAVKKSGIPYTILRPNNFFQNDYWFRDPLLEHGVYPQPYGDVGMSRVDVRDVGEAAAIALTSSKGEGETYNLVGADVLTGEKTAEIWSKALDKKIVYAGNDLEEWERQTLNYLPPWLVFDFKLMYEFFQKEGVRANEEDLERQNKLLGHEPRKFEDFARETADAWLGKAGK